MTVAAWTIESPRDSHSCRARWLAISVGVMLHGWCVAIDWTQLAHINGEGVEKLAARMLRHRYPDAWQVNPSRGDGGIDVFRRTPTGLQVWQIKRFSTPLDSSQRKQVKQSWLRFCATYPAKGVAIHSYTLVTVWTPTEPALESWRTKIVAGAKFPVTWDGELFFDSLDADFPQVAERFLKPDFVESALLAKATLAGSSIESADGFTMLEAARRRDAALAKVRDLVSDHYRIDTAIITTGSNAVLPLGQLNPAGVEHRMTAMEGGRWQVESAVPRSAQALVDDPVTLDVQFRVEPGSVAEEQLNQWNAWGVPIEGVPATVRRTGGPFSTSGDSDGLLSFVSLPVGNQNPATIPDLVLCDPAGAHRVRFHIDEATQGRVGGGRRLVGTSRSGLLRLELRLASTVAPEGWTLELQNSAGLDPRRVRTELTALDALSTAGAAQDIDSQVNAHPGSGFELRLVLDDDEPDLAVQETFAVGTQLAAPPVAKWLLEIAEALVVLDSFSSERLAMPDVREVTEDQLSDLIWHAGIYGGNPETTTWEKVTFTIADGPALAAAWRANSEGYLVETTCPQLELGSEVITIDQPYARTLRMPPLPPTLADAEPGSDVTFYPGADNTMAIGLVVD